MRQPLGRFQIRVVEQDTGQTGSNACCKPVLMERGALVTRRQSAFEKAEPAKVESEIFAFMSSIEEAHADLVCNDTERQRELQALPNFQNVECRY